METVHIQLPDEGGDIGVLEILTTEGSQRTCKSERKSGTNAKTFENSEVGDMTKLSLVLDHEMRC